MQPRRLSILGVGLLGGSVGLGIKAAISNCKVVGYGHRTSSLQTARQMGAIDEMYEDPASAVRGADLIVLCTPVGVFPAMLESIAGSLSPGAIVTDVGSTKASVVEAAGKLLPKSVRFVGSHPMAGSEKRGVEYAEADLLEDALCIVTPVESTDPDALASVESFWRLLGMRTTRLSPAEHDRRLADVSHLPHAVAAALLTMQDDASFELAGKGLADTTRVAGGDGGLWRDIFLDNRQNILGSIERFREELERFAVLLRAGDAGAVKAWLDAAAARREKL